jgi:hypothetical protein
VIRPGEVVVIGPGEVHWHGVQKDHTMVHLVIQEADGTGSVVIWGDRATEHEDKRPLCEWRTSVERKAGAGPYDSIEDFLCT